MIDEGFPRGSFVYLDLENGPPFSAMQKVYVAAWVDAVRANGYAAGVYCSYLFAREVAGLRSNLRVWCYHVATVHPHPVAGASFPAPDPSTCGFSGAVIWQREDEARLTAFDGLACDLDVAAMADPSAPAGPALASAPRPATPVPPAPPTPPTASPEPPAPVPARAPTWLDRLGDFLMRWLFR
jgi:hypothetical protein